jgi:hypothetical protein
MKNNWMLLALVLGGLFLFRRAPANGFATGFVGQEEQNFLIGRTGVPGISGTTGMYGEG